MDGEHKYYIPSGGGYIPSYILAYPVGMYPGGYGLSKLAAGA